MPKKRTEDEKNILRHFVLQNFKASTTYLVLLSDCLPPFIGYPWTEKVRPGPAAKFAVEKATAELRRQSAKLRRMPRSNAANENKIK